MIYTFINGQKKKIDTLYTFINGQKKYIHDIDTFIEGNKKKIYTPQFHPSFYILLSEDTDILYVMNKETKKIYRKIKLPVFVKSHLTKGYYNKQTKKLILLDTWNKYVLIIDCLRNIIISSNTINSFKDYGYNDELGIFYIIKNDLSILNIFDLINNEQYDISIPSLNFTNYINSNIIKKDNKPYFIIGGYNKDTNSIFYYMDISNKDSITPVLYTNQPDEGGNRNAITTAKINPYVRNINTPIIYTRGGILSFSTFLNLIKFNNYAKVNIGDQNFYNFLGYCTSMGYIFKKANSNNFYYCNPNTNSVVSLNIGLSDASKSDSGSNYKLKWTNSLNLNVDENNNQFNYILCSNESPASGEEYSIGLICTGGVFKKFNVEDIYNSIGYTDCSDENNIYFLTSNGQYSTNICDNFITGVHLDNASSSPIVTKYEFPIDFYNEFASNNKTVNGLFVSY